MEDEDVTEPGPSDESSEGAPRVPSWERFLTTPSVNVSREPIVGDLLGMWTSSPLDLGQSPVVTFQTGWQSDLGKLRSELSGLQKAVEQLRGQSVTGDELKGRLSQLDDALSRATQHSEHLTARIIVPRPEDLAVRLVPSDQLDRVEEYRSDQSLYYGMAGVFVGAVLGILSNWATSERFVMTRFSVVLASLLFLLAVFFGLRAMAVGKRAKEVKARQLYFRPSSDRSHEAQSFDKQESENRSPHTSVNQSGSHALDDA